MTDQPGGLAALRSLLAGPAERSLLRLARDAARAALAGDEAPDLSGYSLPEPEVFGAFVSLHEGTRLCGCMGLVGIKGTLARVVAEAAEAAATRDPRFSRLSLEDFERTRVEVSIMSALEPLPRAELPDTLRIGVDGLVISRGSQRGLLLPQVATEHAMDEVAFLEATCRKASLPADAWKKAATVERFSAIVLSE